jgi:hypothetical protein
LISSPHKEGGSLAEPSPSFFSFIRNLWQNKYLDECAKLATVKPYMDGDELETEAAEITISYFYYRARDRLSFYLNDETWRVGYE